VPSSFADEDPVEPDEADRPSSVCDGDPRRTDLSRGREEQHELLFRPGKALYRAAKHPARGHALFDEIDREQPLTLTVDLLDGDDPPGREPSKRSDRPLALYTTRVLAVPAGVYLAYFGRRDAILGRGSE
jgi:hypothetical protein